MVYETRDAARELRMQGLSFAEIGRQLGVSRQRIKQCCGGRNPDRIDGFLETLGKAWKKVPDWKFFQLVCNLQRTIGSDGFYWRTIRRKSLLRLGRRYEYDGGRIMKKEFNECVGCPPELGCIGDSCPHRRVTRYFCDRCGEEETLYYVDGDELCAECVLDGLDVVEGSDE